MQHTKDYIVSLDSVALRAIITTTNPDTKRFAAELEWAKDEMRRRRTARIRAAQQVTA